jgi:tetratricopeptide (TPR) repeat protein
MDSNQERPSARSASGTGPACVPSRLAAAGLGRGAALVALAALAATAPVVGNGWVDWDDDYNFLENPAYRGLGWPQIRWAWTTTHVGAYQPLSWIAFEAQYVAWGLAPRGYHVVSLLLHAAVAVLLYVLAVRLVILGGPGDRGAVPPRHVRLGCALAAALFVAHPLRVEVVSWVSCQPYLPCIFFSMLSVLAYLQAASPAAGPRRRAWMLGAWLLLATAMLFKAVAVAVPLVLAILDVYPLRRLGGGRGWLGPSARKVWWEKVPFLALALVFSVQAVRAKWEDHGPLPPGEAGPIPRIARAAYSVCFYVDKTLWPRELIALYPSPERVTLSEPPFAVDLLIVLGASFAAWLARRRYPGLLAAWLAYLVILAPNTGLVQYTGLLAGDRYAYASTIPLAVLLAAALSWLLKPGRLPRPLAVAPMAVGLALVVALTILSWRQTLTWYDSEALYRYAIAHGAAGNDLAHNNLGAALANKGRVAEAMAQYADAIRLNPAHFRAHYSLGTHLARQGRLDEAIAHFREVIRVVPTSWEAHYNLGLALGRQGKYAEAVAEFARVARLRPDFAEAHSNWGAALALQGRYADAIPHYNEALRLQPGLIEARRNLAEALAKTSRPGAS